MWLLTHALILMLVLVIAVSARSNLYISLQHCRSGSETTSQWRHNEGNSVLNHRRLDCVFNHLVRRRSKKIKSPPHWPLWPLWIPSQSNAEKVSIWCRHHEHLHDWNMVIVVPMCALAPYFHQQVQRWQHSHQCFQLNSTQLKDVYFFKYTLLISTT